MELFSAVEDGNAILRLKNGVHKQTPVYRRGDKLYVPHSGGYIRIITPRWDEAFSTGHPDVKVLEIEGEGITHDGKNLVFKP